MNKLKGVGTYGTLGLDMAVSIALGLWVGRWADNKLHSSPWLLMVGLFLGIAVGFNLLWKAVRKMQQETEREDSREKAELGKSKRDVDEQS